MEINHRVKKIIAYLALIIIIGFNFYLYRNEFKVLSDPNDNIFQYALIDEAKNIWKNVFSQKLSPFYLLDSWNERWSEGFSLSLYYSHLPQAIISLLGIISSVSMEKLFIIVRTLMLVFLPLMFFLATRILDLPLFFGVIAGFFSQIIVTDGLYGIDLSSYLWRGWGLSSQLFALFFLPLAFAYGIDFLENKKNLGRAVIFNFLVVQAHFGMFYLLFIGYPLLILFNRDRLKESIKRLFIFLSLTLISVSYFIIPFFLLGNYRNFSYWDSVWKFNSWGVKQVIIWLINGNLFDFGRLPFLSLTLVLGAFYCLINKRKLIQFLGVLFAFYLFLFVGRTSLGRLIDIFPGFSEYHLHRVIVMVQFVGIFISAWFLYNIIIVIAGQLKKICFKLPYSQEQQVLIFRIIIMAGITLGLLLINQLEKPVIKYAEDNNQWIERANKAYKQDFPTYNKIRRTVSLLPKARVYAGRPGNWGSNFMVGETPVYMALSRDGLAVIGFLPESWSPNSDQEQFFDENNIDFYRLYNAGYLVMPAGQKPPEFAKLILKEGKYALYKVSVNGWFSLGKSSFYISGKKTHFLNITRLWFGSQLFKIGDYPTISLDNNMSIPKDRKIKMLDLNHYKNIQTTPINDEKNIWLENPFNINLNKENLANYWQKEEEKPLVNGYQLRFTLKENCDNCLIVLKQTYHPNWQVKVNGKVIKTYPVFPFFIGIPTEGKGEYNIVAIYKPDSLKVFLIYFEIIFFFLLVFFKRSSLRGT